MTPSDLKVSHGFAQVNGLRYHYVEHGEGPLVVLLHGFPESWWTWRYQIEPLAKAGFRVVAPDQRGYDQTDKQGPYDLDTLSSDISELIHALGEERAHVIGHDWGGAVAFHLAATRPSRVEKLAVLACPHPAKMTRALRSSGRQLLQSWYMFFFQLPLLPDYALGHHAERILPGLYQRAAKDPAHFSPQELRPFIDAASVPGAAHAMLGWYRAGFWRLLAELRGGTDTPSIQASTLMVWPTEDRILLFEALVPGTERFVPNLEVEQLPRCGHFLHAEAPDRVNPLLLAHLGAAVAKPPPTPEVRQVTVVLSDVGENKISVIKEIRAITGLAMKDARELVEAAPKPVKEHVSIEDAERISRQLTAAGAKVEVR